MSGIGHNFDMPSERPSWLPTPGLRKISVAYRFRGERCRLIDKRREATIAQLDTSRTA